MLRIAVAKVVLDKPEIAPLVSQVEPTGVPEHMGMDVRQLCLLRDSSDHVTDRLSCHWQRLASGRFQRPSGNLCRVRARWWCHFLHFAAWPRCRAHAESRRNTIPGKANFLQKTPSVNRKGTAYFLRVAVNVRITTNDIPDISPKRMTRPRSEANVVMHQTVAPIRLMNPITLHVLVARSVNWNPNVSR